MKKALSLLLFGTTILLANINVAATYPYLGVLAERIGGEQVHVVVLGEAKYDPHFVIPKPSLISKLNRADLLLINGGGLEIGWLPPLLSRANNGRINPGSEGFADASQVVQMIEIPKAVSRAFGDVHPEGNPHYNTDPHNMLPVATLIAHKLEMIDPEHKAIYMKNLEKFTREWQRFLKRFDALMQSCQGKKVIQYHKLYDYLLQRYHIEAIGTIEPLPGIAPSSKHTMELIALMKQSHVNVILQDPYHEKKTAKFIAAKTHASIALIPHDVGAVKGANTLEKFYTQIAERLCR